MKEVNKKITSSIIMLFVASMVLSLLLGAVAGKDLKLKDKSVTYEFEGITSGEYTTTYLDTSGYPELVIAEQFTPIEALYYWTIIIDGVYYSYPGDFTYSDYYYVEANYVTFEAIYEVDFEFTFNLPGNPTIIGHSSALISSFNTPDRHLQGTLTLVGTGLFDKVKGYAEDEGWSAEGYWHIVHTGVLKEWPDIP